MKGPKTCQDLLLAFLLRYGHRYSDKTYWTKAHESWIADIKMPHRAEQIALQEYIHATQEQLGRVQRPPEETGRAGHGPTRSTDKQKQVSPRLT